MSSVFICSVESWKDEKKHAREGVSTLFTGSVLNLKPRNQKVLGAWQTENLYLPIQFQHQHDEEDQGEDPRQ